MNSVLHGKGQVAAEHTAARQGSVESQIYCHTVHRHVERKTLLSYATIGRNEINFIITHNTEEWRDKLHYHTLYTGVRR
jgi:hypothetical protein